VPDVTAAASGLGHACLGLEALGPCNYDPAKPFTVYFAPGAAVGALAFTLAVQQLLKPVHRFRLATRYLTLSRIYVCVFGGVAATVVAAILPDITSLHGGPWGYPINWEILATLLFVLSYAAVVTAIVRPVRARPARLPDFAQQAADYSHLPTNRIIVRRMDAAFGLPRILSSISRMPARMRRMLRAKRSAVSCAFARP
jgi:hypothetical protein